MKRYDVIVVGAGPAGSVAAAILAGSGRGVLILDKSKFPRDKVCGDCLNPSAWRILDRLDLSTSLRAHMPTEVNRVEFFGAAGQNVAVNIPPSPNPEVVIRRRDLDAMLVEHAIAQGAEFLDDTTVRGLLPGGGVDTERGAFGAPVLLAADGRNSTIARMTGRLPKSSRERIALQAHVPSDLLAPGRTVRMFFHPLGYGGVAALNAKETNLCLVARAKNIDGLKQYAMDTFRLDSSTKWNSITPLRRKDAQPLAHAGVFLLGDAARVVEPFTGEGIYYAMRSGELAADALLAHDDVRDAEQRYARDHREVYRGRLWINLVSRTAALHPVLTSHLLPLAKFFPAPLSLLTRKVVMAGNEPGCPADR